MDFNHMRGRASELHLVRRWNSHTGNPKERRLRIFQEFIQLGMVGRWQWHAAAERYEFADFTEAEKEILECRTDEARDIAFSMSAGSRAELSRILMTDDRSTLDLSIEWPGHWTDDKHPWLVCEYDAGTSPFLTLPEIVYSMTTYDDPADAAELRAASISEVVEQGHGEPDQSLWVSGVFRVEGRIVWVDEYGESIREMVFDASRLEEDSELFDNVRPFETSWWVEGRRMGKYAAAEWWQ